ncbi:MAG: glycine cleavage system aminomethyltransferase GcvT [Bacteroidota bacterium]
MIKRTPLYDDHITAGAKMVEFAGFHMPIRYKGVSEEHKAVRQSVGMFDVSHMGQFYIRGPHAIDLLKKISSNDPEKLSIGQAQYSCMPTDALGIVDDLLIYRTAEHEYLLVVNASNIEKDWEWISSHNEVEAQMENVSDSVSLIALQGPQAKDVLEGLTSADLGNLKYYTFTTANVGAVSDVLISATGYTGSGGYELYIDSAHASIVWQLLIDAGVPPIGLGARDTLRLEKGYCLYGNDIDETTSPLEAGLAWITKWNHDFVGKEVLLRQKEEGVPRRLVAIRMNEKGIPRQGYSILSTQGEVIGHVTSGTQSPSLGVGIGMGYVKSGYHKTGTLLQVQIRAKQLSAEVIRLPFV